MNAAVATPLREPKVENFDVLVVGAGISGIGAAYHLTTQCPGTRFVVLESLESFGGTWLTHKYPGVRSDSDLYTFGYRFKPWTGVPIATAEEILAYMGEVIDENDLARRIRYRHKIVSAKWSSKDNLWLIEAQRSDTGETLRFTANFLWMCQGYYRHSEGYTPEWPDMAKYKGQIVHPQTWPEDLDYHGKNVVVIGSGATAATLIPAIAADCGHVTMLQRSPTYFRAARNANDLADMLRELKIDETWIHEIVRRKILHDQDAFTRRTFEEPEAVKQELIGAVRDLLGADYDVATHFTPTYRPWRQRLAFVPDGDLFQGIRSGKASVVTDEIERFTETGIMLKSGTQLEADIIVTATGLKLVALGDIQLKVDGRTIDPSKTMNYRGTMYAGIPNLASVFGYTNASWTLKSELTCNYICRVLNRMSREGYQVCVPQNDDPSVQPEPWLNLSSGYIQRVADKLPKQGSKVPWKLHQNYVKDIINLRYGSLDDGVIRFLNPTDGLELKPAHS